MSEWVLDRAVFQFGVYLAVKAGVSPFLEVKMGAQPRHRL